MNPRTTQRETLSLARQRAEHRSYRRRRRARRYALGGVSYVVLIVGAFVCLAPFIWMVLSAFKDPGDIFNIPPDWLPPHPTSIAFWNAWNNYPNGEGMFGQWYVNTAVVAVIWTVANVLFCSLAGYAFARIRFPGRNVIFMSYLATLMIPYVVLLIPSYILVSKLGWVDTYQGLVVPGLFGTPFGTFLMRQFFMTLPLELDEAALIDGASRLRVFFQIAVPLSLPAVATLSTITFVGAWNNFIWPLLVTNSEDKKLLTVGLQDFIGGTGGNTNWADLMAGSTLALLPLLVLFFAMQRFIVQGIQFTGIK